MTANAHVDSAPHTHHHTGYFASPLSGHLTAVHSNYSALINSDAPTAATIFTNRIVVAALVALALVATVPLGTVDET